MLRGNWLGPILAGVALLFVALRFVGLSADPPNIFRHLGQGLLTDPYYYTWFARNLVLFGEADPLGYSRYEIFAHTIVSGLSYLVFLVAGVSRVTAHLSGLILSLTGLTLFTAAWWRRISHRQLLLLAVLLSSNVLLFFYSRYPLLESGLLVYSGLLTFVFVRYGSTRWGQFAAGLLIAAAALTGKLLGAMLAAPIVVALLVQWRRRSAVPLAMTTAGLLCGFVLYVAIFWGGSLGGIADYIDEVRATVVADDSATPTNYIVSLLSFWANPAVSGFHSIPLATALLGAIAMILTRPGERPGSRWQLAYNVSWIAAVTIVLCLPAWRPIRHFLFALLPMAWLAARGLEQALSGEVRLAPPNRWRWLAVFLVMSLLAALIVAQFDLSTDARALVSDQLLLILSIAGSLTVAMWFALRSKTVRPAPQGCRVIAYAALALALGQSSHFIIGELSTPHYQMRQLNRDLAELLPESTVMTGTFGPALTIDNDLRGILEFLGPRPPERDLVAHYDVSHVALPSTRWRFLVENTDVTDMAPAVFVKSIRGASIQMRRMTPVGHGMTPFDSLLDAFFVGDTVRARGLADRLMAAHPENLMLQQLDAKIRYLSRDLSGTLTALEHLSEQNPDNYDVQYDCAAMCAKCYWASRARQVYRMVQRYVDRCRRLDAPETPSVDELLQITKPSGR